jgi:hypothetical protein
MDERGPGVAGRACQRQDGKRIDLERQRRLIFRIVHRVVSRTVDDDVRAFSTDYAEHVHIARHVEIAAGHWQDGAGRSETVGDCTSELPGRARHEDTHQEVTASPSASTTAACCSGRSSP